MVKCHPIVEDLAANVKHHEVPATAFATSALQGLYRTLEEITGAVDNVEAVPTVEDECTNLDELTLTKQLGCRSTRKLWPMLSRKS